MSGKAIVSSIERNVAQLIGENRKLRGEVERLAASRDRLREENRSLAAALSTAERRLIIKELAAGFGGNGVGRSGGDGSGRVAGIDGGGSNPAGLDRRGTKIARARVNRLLREVDRCIGLLRMENEK
jgi:hypothetical protein